MTCGSCGGEIQDLADRCPRCGTSLSQAAGQEVVAGVRPMQVDPDTTCRRDDTVASGATLGVNPVALRGAALETGQAFGHRYHIMKTLGVGGMGAVYQAWDGELGVAVALKVIRPDATEDGTTAQDLERRFKRELLLARQVTHKHVVRIYDLGEIGGIKYITMAYLEGADLATVLKDKEKLSIAEALRIARQVVSGLQAAHEAGVVHRDLKPANIMIEDDQAIIMDFGIAGSNASGLASPAPAAATHTQLHSALEHTQSGSIVGTLRYMAPEQAKGLHVDQRADIYALGLILRDMLLGRRPLASGESAWDELNRRIEQALPSARSVDPGIPEATDHVIMRCLMPDPAARYQTAADLLADLDRLDEEGNLKPEPRRLSPRVVAAGGVVLASVIASLVWGTWRLASAPPPPAHAPTSVLVVDLDNQTGDPVFNESVEETLTRGIEGASFVNAYSRASAHKLAGQIKPGSQLDEQTARLVARSEGIQVLLVSAIARSGSAYDVSVRAIDPAADPQSTPLAVATATARTKEEVLQRVGTLAARIRGPLGDTTPESARLAAAETFTTSSAEAVKTYVLGQDLLFAGRTSEAYDAYQRTIQQDATFGRAYAGAGIAARRMGREAEAKELWDKAISLMDRMTDREKSRTLGAYYLDVARNYQKAIENFKTLVTAYPADRAGHASLALAYFWALDIPKALEEEKLAVALDPRSILARANYALYAMYAGDFDTAVKEAKQVIAQQPTLDLAYVPLAMAALASDDANGAREAYAAMAREAPSSASLEAVGLADIAVYQGRYRDVEAILKPAIAADEKSGNAAGASAKWIVLAEAYEGQRNTAAALAAARKASKLAQGQPLQLLAASILIRNGQGKEASATSAGFSQQLEAQSRAYGKILEGRIALKERRMADAVDALTAAQKLADLWMARFDLGVAYLEAGHFAEGLAELELCQKRRGEATAVFLDEVPSFRYLSTLPYWLGRAQEGVGQRAAAMTSYKAFLAVKSGSPDDQLVIDARKRSS